MTNSISTYHPHGNCDHGTCCPWHCQGCQMPTFKVTILGPNLPADAGEAVHVHAAGCADIARNRWYRKAEGWTIDAASVLDVVADVYPPSDFGYDLADSDDRSAYESDVRFFPCTASLPYEVAQ